MLADSNLSGTKFTYKHFDLSEVTVPETRHKTNADISILYVEDESATREQVSRILSARGYRVTIAENGRKGLDAFREQLPDIVLTDIMMPELNGLEMAREIRIISPESQIVCLTAFSDTSYLIEAIDIGINQFVFKPVEFSYLLSVLDHCKEMVELRNRNRKLEAENILARKMEAIGLLAGGMAHDFNNLLQVILGYISLARMNAEPGSKTEKWLMIAEDTSETARELGRRLLTFAKGGNNLMQTTDIKPLIVTIVDEELGSSDIDHTIDIPDNLPPLLVDAGQIGQVITQLVINAREAMPHGGSLNISASTLRPKDNDGLALEPGDYLLIVCKDTGVGISTENLPKIFDPYYSTKEMGCQKGMGLGLALSHSIIRHHRGKIIAESKLGEGTEIHLYLPVAFTTSPENSADHSLP